MRASHKNGFKKKRPSMFNASTRQGGGLNTRLPSPPPAEENARTCLVTALATLSCTVACWLTLNVPWARPHSKKSLHRQYRTTKGAPPCQKIPNVFLHLHTSLITKIKWLFVCWILCLQTPHLSNSPTAALPGIWLPLAVPEATSIP